MGTLRPLIGALMLGLSLAAQAVGAPYAGDFPWREWSDQVFEQAAREKKFVLVSLQSWWCPWCHAMKRETYDDPGVRKYLLRALHPVRVTRQPARHLAALRALGWPATIIFGPDGTEIVKLRGSTRRSFHAAAGRDGEGSSPVDYGTRGGRSGRAR